MDARWRRCRRLKGARPASGPAPCHRTPLATLASNVLFSSLLGGADVDDVTGADRGPRAAVALDQQSPAPVDAARRTGEHLARREVDPNLLADRGARRGV